MSITIYTPWLSLPSSDNGRYKGAREAVARGEALFDTHPVAITDVTRLIAASRFELPLLGSNQDSPDPQGAS